MSPHNSFPLNYFAQILQGVEAKLHPSTGRGSYHKNTLNNRITQCSAKGLNWKKMALKRKIHGWDRMIMLNTGTALKYSNLVEVTTFLGKN